jgi:hypothetical protein
MRQLLISSVARNLVTSASGMPPQWDKALRKNGQLAVDIIIAMQKWNLEKESIPDPRQDSVKPILEDAEQARAQKKDGQDDEEQSNEQDGEENDEENNEEETEEGAEDGEKEEGEDNEEGEQETEEPQE